MTTSPLIPVALRLRQTPDDGVELHHDTGQPLAVTLELPEYPGRVGHQRRVQIITDGLWTTLRFPSPEHCWVEISTLGGSGREWTCSECGARLTETPQ